ncbi:MAG: tetratricopeptide repeat protein, partial [Pseudomonadota bacterium]
MTSLHRLNTIKTHAVISALTITLASSISFAGVGAGSGGSGGSIGTTSGIADREISRRLQRVQEAQNAIEKGDKLLVEGDPEGALAEYKTAIDLLPEAPATQAWRDAATARYCNASVALAKQRAKNGRYADAKSLLAESLARNPDHSASKTLLKQLDDPERYEPALTPEHVKNVEDVNRNLKLAASFENLGDHDNANKANQDALRIDKYNSAARRNMERIEREKSIYFDAARDHTRVKMLNDVNKLWEEQIPMRFDNITVEGGSSLAPTRYYTEKMQRINFPTVQFQGASIEEAIEFLRIKSRDLDTFERDPAKRGVNIILKPGQAPSTASISLDLHDVPMVDALKYITELAGMKYKVEPYAVLV